LIGSSVPFLKKNRFEILKRRAEAVQGSFRASALEERLPEHERSAAQGWGRPPLSIGTRFSRGFPNSFTLKQFTSRSESKGKSPAYLRQIAATWVKRGKTKRVGLGKYQKVEQKKLRAA
jgi:hypothetical protein